VTEVTGVFSSSFSFFPLEEVEHLIPEEREESKTQTNVQDEDECRIDKSMRLLMTFFVIENCDYSRVQENKCTSSCLKFLTQQESEID
jgi:hypothetical protein